MDIQQSKKEHLSPGCQFDLGLDGTRLCRMDVRELKQTLLRRRDEKQRLERLLDATSRRTGDLFVMLFWTM